MFSLQAHNQVSIVMNENFTTLHHHFIIRSLCHAFSNSQYHSNVKTKTQMLCTLNKFIACSDKKKNVKCKCKSIESILFFIILQQILFHLSQITPRRHTIRLKESKSDRKTNKSAAHNQYEILCQESFCEAVRNFQTSTNATILEIPLTSIMKQKPLATAAGSHTQTRSAIKHLDRLENTIKTSYVSKDTFQENKAEPMPDARPLNNNININISHPKIFLIATNLVHQLSQPMVRSSMQTRGFRTHRNIESQLKRNPSFSSRIQQFFGKHMQYGVQGG